jgi:hypothetical protein
MGYERFSAEIFSCPFLVVRAARAAPVGRLALLSMLPLHPTARYSRSGVRDSLLQPERDRSPVPKPCQHDRAGRFWQENVSMPDSRTMVTGSADPNAFRAVSSPRRRRRYTPMGAIGSPWTASSPSCARPAPTCRRDTRRRALKGGSRSISWSHEKRQIYTLSQARKLLDRK